MEIERNGEKGSVTIGHKQYIDGLLREYGMENCKPNATPLEVGYQSLCTVDDCPRANEKQYQSLIRSLLYLVLITRLDIVHSVAKLAQRCSEPQEHELAAKRILRYLKGTSGLQLHYARSGMPVHCYVDGYWAGDSIDRKSFSGWAFFMAGAACSWESKKQSIIALSRTEAEYVALSTSTKEAAYDQKIISEMGYKTASTLMIYSDNQGAQCLAKNAIFHARSKHIDIKYHYIRDLYKKNIIDIEYVATEDIISDVLTKNLSKVKHIKCISSLGLN